MSARAFVVFMVVLAVIGLLGFGLFAKGEESIAVGDTAPEAELPRLDRKGTGSIADYRGEWVLVNFWASWCVPCREESPDLQGFWEQHRDDGFVILGIDTQDLTDDALDFIREFGLTYPMIRDPDTESPLSKEAFGSTGLPESFLIDPQGQIRLIRRGPVDTKYLDRFVATRLEKR